MPALVYLIGAPDSGRLMFALVVEGGQAEYIGRPGDPNVPSNTALASLLEEFEALPSSTEEWNDLVFARHSSSEINGPVEVDSFDEGLAFAETTLIEDPTPSLDAAEGSTTNAARAAFDDMLYDHPDFISSLEDESFTNPEGDVDEPTPIEDPSSDPMLLFMIQMHGPIDPEGPNGWMLRALDGEPIPEDAYISLKPPAPEPSAAETEE